MLVVNKIISVFKRFSWFKRFNAKITYEVLAKYIPAADWHFMNYGYIPDAKERDNNTPPFAVKDQRHSANMYHYLACKVQLTGKKIKRLPKFIFQGLALGGDILGGVWVSSRDWGW